MASLSGLSAKLLLGCLATTVAYQLYRFASDPLRKVPGPFWARLTRFWYLLAIHKGDFERQNVELHRKYGPIVRVGPDMYSINDPEAAAVIYGTHNVFPKSRWYFTFQQPDEPNIFSTNNNKYAAEVRRKYKPAYDSFPKYEYAVDNCCKLLDERITEFAVKGTDVNVPWWMTCFAFDVNGELTFGKRFGHLDKGEDIGNIAADLAERLDYVSHVGIFPYLHPIFWKLIMLLAFLTKKIDSTYVFAQNQLEEHERRDLEEAKGPRPLDMLDRFMAFHKENPQHFTTNDVLIGAYSSIAGGADTTWISLSSIIHYLHAYPKTLEKLREEIDTKTREGKLSDPVTFEESKNLVYLNAVIKEAQRMHSPTGFPLWRVVPESGATLCGYYFPPGTTVGVNTWVAHRASAAFNPDPDVFRPERWIEADREQLLKMNASHIPFGMGPRICQGQTIAMMEMGKMIPQLLRKFEFDLGRDWETFNHWLVGVKGMNCKVKLRKSGMQ